MLKAISGRSESNVFFVNNDGTIRWQIEPLVSPDDPNNNEIGYAGYTWIGFTESGELEVVYFRSYTCMASIETGKLYNCYFDK